MNLHDVIIGPMMTEKTEELKGSVSNANRYTLLINRRANKELVRQALHKIYNVKVAKIQTLILPGKMKRFRYDTVKLPSKKKAIVTLEPGQSITFGKSV